MKKRLLTLSFICLFSFTQIPGIQNVSAAVLLDRIVATVNEEVITWSELMSMIIIDGKQLLSGLTVNEREQKIREMERPFLENLIEMKLQLQVAQRMEIDVSDAEVEGAIDEIKMKYGLTEETLRRSLEAQGLNLVDYRARLADQILLQKVINTAVRINVVISDKEIEQYYEENRGGSGGDEKLRISQILFISPGDDSQRGELEVMAQDLVDRIRSGEDFGALAREYSQDPSGEFGGDLGYIARGSVLREIEDTAAALQVGEVSDPVWSPAGLHIIKLDDRVGGGSTEQSREDIREALFQKTFENKFREWNAGLRENAYIEIKL
jgi:peptidyl-prolyl cis-trans isomerase SurA